MQAVKRRDKLVRAFSDYFNSITSHQIGFCSVTTRQISLPCSPTNKQRLHLRKGHRNVTTTGDRKVQTTDRDQTTALSDRPKSPFGPVPPDKGPSLFAGSSLKNENKQITQLILKINEEFLNQVNKPLTSQQGQQNDSSLKMSHKGDLLKNPSEKYLKYFHSTKNNETKKEKGAHATKCMLQSAQTTDSALDQPLQIGNPELRKTFPLTSSNEKEYGTDNQPTNNKEFSVSVSPSSKMIDLASSSQEKGNLETKLTSVHPLLNKKRNASPKIEPPTKYSMTLNKRPVLFSSRELLFSHREKPSAGDSKEVKPNINADKLLSKLSDSAEQNLTISSLVPQVDKRISNSQVSPGETSKEATRGSVVVRKRVPDKKWKTVVNKGSLPVETGKPVLTNEDKVSNTVNAITGKLAKYKGLTVARVKSKQITGRKRLQLVISDISKNERKGGTRATRSNAQSLSVRKTRIGTPKLPSATPRISRRKKLEAIPLRIPHPSTRSHKLCSLRRSSEFQLKSMNNIKPQNQFQASNRQPTTPAPSVNLQDSNRTPVECQIETSLVCIPQCKPPFSSITAPVPPPPPPPTQQPTVKRDPLEFIIKTPAKGTEKETSKSTLEECSAVNETSEKRAEQSSSTCRTKVRPKCAQKRSSSKPESNLLEKTGLIGFLQLFNDFRMSLLKHFRHFYETNARSTQKSLSSLLRHSRLNPTNEKTPSRKPKAPLVDARQVAKRKIYSLEPPVARKKVRVLRKVKCKVFTEAKKDEIIKELTARKSNPKANPSLSYSDVLRIIFGKGK